MKLRNEPRQMSIFMIMIKVLLASRTRTREATSLLEGYVCAMCVCREYNDNNKILIFELAS